ncbi:MAG: DUF2585 family protein [Proteobacteria bacterium]|nr:DUF2585 family protein [Pseudomonadota bacterium]
MKSRVLNHFATPWILLIGYLGVLVFKLHLQDRLWFSASGKILPWVGDIWSSENSQQFFDPYSSSHFLHGVIFYGLIYLLVPKLSFSYRFLFCCILEGSWEMLENSPLIINRYREATAALGYSGDTILNSFGDVLSCGLGFIVANYTRLKGSILLIIIIELLMLISVRDNLTLNIIMLICPQESIKAWQIAN